MTSGSRDRTTIDVPPAIFREVYDSPASLPGRRRRVTPDEDVRTLEDLLGLPDGSVGAPLWISGDELDCPSCARQLSWLDIVASAAGSVHSAEMIAKVVLGERKYVNVEAPDHVAGVVCFSCGTEIQGLRSFKCHNWAYAYGDLTDLLARIAIGRRQDVGGDSSS